MDDKKWDIYSPKAEQLYSRRILYFSLLIVGLVLLTATGFQRFVLDKSQLYSANLGIFDSISPHGIAFSNASEGTAGSIVSINADSFFVGSSLIQVDLRLKNNTSVPQTVGMDHFSITSYNTEAPEIRCHYYPTIWDSIQLSAGEEITRKVTFSVPEADNKLNNGYLFTLSVNENEPDAAELILGK